MGACEGQGDQDEVNLDGWTWLRPSWRLARNSEIGEMGLRTLVIAMTFDHTESKKALRGWSRLSGGHVGAFWGLLGPF